jgi:hypothetical protein
MAADSHSAQDLLRVIKGTIKRLPVITGSAIDGGILHFRS